MVGAHYDHLGHGGSYSLAPDDHSAHVGADDNASGVSLVLEVARSLSQSKTTRRDVVFATFTAEEMGVLGSSHLVKNPPPGLEAQNVYAMFNYDMVGRMTENSLSVLGAESAEEWTSLVPKVCDAVHVECHLSGSGYGPSDHSSFYTAGIPVLHFFTGAHSDYHKPSDVASRINGAGVAQIAALTEHLLADEPQLAKLSYRKVAPEDPRGDMRSFNASLGTIPDYGGPPDQKGVLLSDVRPGSGAAQGGMQRGDVLVQLGDKSIEGVHDLMFALNAAKPHQTVKAIVLRDGKRVEMKVTYQERGGGGGKSPHGPATPAEPKAEAKPAHAPLSACAGPFGNLPGVRASMIQRWPTGERTPRATGAPATEPSAPVRRPRLAVADPVSAGPLRRRGRDAAPGVCATRAQAAKEPPPAAGARRGRWAPARAPRLRLRVHGRGPRASHARQLRAPGARSPPRAR